jgi:hypothetical protein
MNATSAKHVHRPSLRLTKCGIISKGVEMHLDSSLPFADTFGFRGKKILPLVLFAIVCRRRAYTIPDYLTR